MVPHPVAVPGALVAVKRLPRSPTAATRSGRFICRRQRSPRSPDSHLRFESKRHKNMGYPVRVSHILVPLTGLEPVRVLPQGILSPWCLPIPPIAVPDSFVGGKPPSSSVDRCSRCACPCLRHWRRASSRPQRRIVFVSLSHFILSVKAVRYFCCACDKTVLN